MYKIPAFAKTTCWRVIVRRIDDLGRIVIPKEIRRTMHIREGDPLEITLSVQERFTDALFKLAERFT